MTAPEINIKSIVAYVNTKTVYFPFFPKKNIVDIKRYTVNNCVDGLACGPKMPRMGKKKNMPAVMEKEQQRSGRNFNFWADGELASKFFEFLNSLRPKGRITDHLEQAVMEYLERKGFWPPSSSD